MKFFQLYNVAFRELEKMKKAGPDKISKDTPELILCNTLDKIQFEKGFDNLLELQIKDKINWYIELKSNYQFVYDQLIFFIKDYQSQPI